MYKALLMLAATMAAFSAPAKSAGDTYTWTPSGLSGGGAMFSPAISPVNPKLMMINCDMGAAYVSRDGGKIWDMIHYSQLRTNTECKPAFHPAEAKTVFAANSWSGLAVSKDAGKTWKNIGNLPGNLSGEIAINPRDPQQMLAGTSSGVWRSADAGASWEECSGVKGRAIAFHFDQTAEGAYFACTDKGLWISTDKALSWKSMDRPLPEQPVLDFSGGSNGRVGCILYLTVPGTTVDGSYVGGIYKSVDRGKSWICMNNSSLNLETKAFDEWAMGDVAQYRKIITTNADPTTVYAFNSNTGIPPPHHASVYRSSDAGKSWRSTFSADPRWPAMNVQKDYTVVEDGQFYQEVPKVAICQNNPKYLLLVDGGRAYTTDNGGLSWQASHILPGSAEGTWLCNGLVVTTTWNYYIDPSQANNHYICYTDIGFARSSDKGKSWRLWGLQGRARWKNTCYELAFDPEVPGKVWGAFSDVHDIPNDNIISGRHNNNGGGGICLSTDYAATWQNEAQNLPVQAATSIVLDPRSSKGNRTLYAGLFGKGVYRSSDDGKNWEAVNDGLGANGNRRVSKVSLHPDGTLFAMVTALKTGGKFTSEGVGLHRSKDKGQHWELVNRSQTLLWPKDFTVDPKNSNVIYIGAADAGEEKQGGLWRTTDGGKSWNRILRKGPEHFGAYLDPNHPGWIFATLTEGAPEAGIWLSKDNGKSWSALEGLPFGNAQRVAFDSADKDSIYVTTFGGSIWRGTIK